MKESGFMLNDYIHITLVSSQGNYRMEDLKGSPKPVMDDAAIASALASEEVTNSPFASPDKDDLKNDPNFTDDESSNDIFESVSVGSSAKSFNNSALNTSGNQLQKSVVSSRGRGSFLFGLHSLPDSSSGYQSTFFGNNRGCANLRASNQDFENLPKPKSDINPANFFKHKSNFKPLGFSYESANEKQSSDCFRIDDLPVDKTAAALEKAYDNWVRRYLKLTENLPDAQKLPVIDTSELNLKFDRAKIADDSGGSRSGANKKNQKNNCKPPANGKKNKNLNQNQFSSERQSSSPTDDGWKSRDKGKFEKNVRTSPYFGPSSAKSGRDTSANDEDPYDFKIEDCSPDFPKQTKERTEQIKTPGKPKAELKNSRAEVEVQFNFDGKIMDNKTAVIPKPNQSAFSEAIRKQGQGIGHGSPICEQTFSSLNRNSKCKGKPPVLKLRDPGPEVNGKQLQRNTAESLEASSIVPPNNEQLCDKENEETYPCPLCEKQFKAKDIEHHVNSCLDIVPPQTRSRDQAHTSGKKRPLESVEPEDLITCSYCEKHYHRRDIKEHEKKCCSDSKIINVSSSDEESNSIATKIQRIE